MVRVHAFDDDVLGQRDATELSRLLRAGEVSVRELVDAAIRRADFLQPTLNPVHETDYDRARDHADRLDREGLADGALAGLPVFMKDNVVVEGLPTMMGSAAFTGRPAKKGNKRGPSYAYNVKELRDREKAVAEQAERAYEQLVAGRRQKSSKRHTGPATAAGSSG